MSVASSAVCTTYLLVKLNTDSENPIIANVVYINFILLITPNYNYQHTEINNSVRYLQTASLV